MLIKEYQGFFEEVNKSNDTKKNGKNDKKEVDKKRVRNRRKKVSEQSSV